MTAERPSDRPPAPVPAYAEIAASLRDRIIAGEFKPGDRLPIEPDLSAEHGVSRSTVREALRLLASQGLLTTTRGVAGGSFVAYPQPDQITEYLATSLNLLTLDTRITVDQLLEIREMLEVPAAGLAAVRGDEALRAELRGSLFDPSALGPAELFAPNRHFHTVLLKMAGNPFLEVVTQPVFRVLNERFLRENAPARFWYGVDHDHREILSRIEAADEAGAREACHAHLENLRETYTTIDRTHQAGDGSAAGD
ncbi:GntR family transcriptional regulator [Actinomadura citrea]|uniref:FadR/GntR family transcriptional regulator n=1 Tax=Actinomadura citrea TaxID=46158 RepID=UPI002E280A1B|nr:GntR family transcriptional regulator [Actinomadura citrea]